MAATVVLRERTRVRALLDRRVGRGDTGWPDEPYDCEAGTPWQRGLWKENSDMSEATPGERVEDKSLGDLVALASSNVSDLVRAEMDLAKMELKADAKKGAVSGVMLVIAAVIGGIIVILLSIALALGLAEWWNGWAWAAFLVVAGLYALLAIVLGLVAKRLIGKIEGAKRTRKTLKETPGALRHRGGADAPALTD